LGTIKEALEGEDKSFLNRVDSDDLDESGTKKKDLVEESSAATATARKPSALRGVARKILARSRSSYFIALAWSNCHKNSKATI
jgi:hypothetical protein